jgi:hypothetical protein
VLTLCANGCTVYDMSTYVANVVSTTGTWTTVRVEAKSHATVKAAARRAAKAQGMDVKYVNDFFII